MRWRRHLKGLSHEKGWAKVVEIPSASPINKDLFVTDKGNGGQPACPEEWKKCKEEHE
jgi:hypothetical protein